MGRRRLLLLLGCAAAAGACERPPLKETPPRLVSEAKFAYPEDLWDARVEGQTTLRIFVAADGTVDTVRVEQSSGYPAFDSSAVAGSRKLRFEPARRGEEAVGDWFRVPVRFDLVPADSTPRNATQ